jgi:DNA-binding NarL/FixJ family response regulator
VIRVLIADDQPLVRAGLRVLLEGEEDIVVVGEASSGREAVATARDAGPDVVLMDIRMPELGGLEATRVVAGDPDLATVKILILTTYDGDEFVFEALRAGASGFLVKDTDAHSLAEAVRIIARGEGLLSPGVTSRLIAEFASRPNVHSSTLQELGDLTPREREVVALVGLGLDNDQIAADLAISPATAKTHVSRAMRKLHAHDRAQLVVFAYESGLIMPGRHSNGTSAEVRRHS